MNNWKKFINDKSHRAFTALMELYPQGPSAFSLDARDYEYTDLRASFLRFDAIATEAAKKSDKKTYTYDLEFGLRIYECLNKEGFGLWQAADNGCWAYLSICIVPDLVHKRWEGYNPDRFYKRNWRIWLKALWWYIHLLESGRDEVFNLEATRELLKNFSQDFLYLLLDHSAGGFRDTVYHELVCQLREVGTSKKIKGDIEDFFRSVMLQHQIRSTVIDPILVGEKAYVKSLLEVVLPKFTEVSNGK